MAAKFSNHPVSRDIVEAFINLDMSEVFWDGDVLIASLDKECQASPLKENLCISLHFDFDHQDDEYSEDMQVVTIESCVEGSQLWNNFRRPAKQIYIPSVDHGRNIVSTGAS